MKSSATDQLTPRTQAALQYLQRTYNDQGYSIERYLASTGKYQVRLKRRNNVLITDEGYDEIVVDRSVGYIVGIQVTSRGDVGRGIVLIDENGKICSSSTNNKEVTVQMANVSTTGTSNATRRSGPSRDPSSSTRSSSTRSAAANTNAATNPANNELLIKYGLCLIGAILLLKVIFNAINFLTIFILPILYLYASANCPSNDTFDAKKELKRVMRGAHLPEENQPKGFFEQGFNRLAASIATEMATSLGYEISMTDYAGAAKLASVKVPIAGYTYHWIGILDKWRYIGQREIPGSNIS